MLQTCKSENVTNKAACDLHVDKFTVLCSNNTVIREIFVVKYFRGWPKQRKFLTRNIFNNEILTRCTIYVYIT